MQPNAIRAIKRMIVKKGIQHISNIAGKIKGHQNL